MTHEAFGPRALPDDFATKVGVIVRARGPLLEARFPPGAQPPILNALSFQGEAGSGPITASVIQHLPGGHVRSLILATRDASGAAADSGATIADLARPLDAAADVTAIATVLGTLRPAAADWA